MATEKIPEVIRFKCDVCGNFESVPLHSKPKHWRKLVILREAYDAHDIAMADATVTRDLCGGCGEVVERAINEACQRMGQSHKDGV